MGKVLSINLDERTASYILRIAQTNVLTPSEVVRRRIYEFFNLPREHSPGYLPRYHYAVKDRYVIRVYLRDDVYEMVENYVKENKMSLAEFIRNLFAVEVIERA